MRKLMLGDFAVARGAWEAGVKVASAYPGTPSTEITEELARYDEVYSEWSPNEKVALEVGIGASIRGARAIVSMKHVGLNVACDPLFTASYTGVNGGLVIAVADDPSVFSSQNEQDTRLTAVSAQVPVLEPSDSAEAKEFTKLAFELSEKYDTPVILRVTTRVAHSQSLVELEERQETPNRAYERNIAKYVMMPANARVKHVVVEERMQKLSDDSNSFAINRIEEGDKELGIICSGGVYQYVKEALPNASVLKLGMVHPLPFDLIAKFAKSVKRCIVAEELAPHIETQVKAHGIAVEGKNIFPRCGEFSANLIHLPALRRVFRQPHPRMRARRKERNQRRKRSRPPAGLVRGLPAPRRVLCSVQAEAQRAGRHRLLHAGRRPAPRLDGRRRMHGGERRHGDRLR